jgi:hypothetical protein
MTRALPSALATLLTGCMLSGGSTAPATCQVDEDCGPMQVCFPEGCGDPGRGLVVEVEGNPRSGPLAQDFLIADGGFQPNIPIQLLPATTLSGEFTRNLGPSDDPGKRALYSETVTVKARGESELIPGVVRSYQATFAHPERGTYSLPVGAGRFTVSAQPEDSSIPPGIKEATVGAGSSAMLSFVFPSAEGTLTLSGRLLTRVDPGPPRTEIAVTQAGMDLQAFNPITKRPISQLVHASSGTLTSPGDFVISIAPEALKLDSFLIVATPREPGTLVPSKTFTIARPFPQPLTLELGDFGDPYIQLEGDLVTTAGLPIVAGIVYFTGPVVGGGTFQSKVVSTDGSGHFTVDLLPNLPNGSYVMTALPPPDSAAGVAQIQVKIVAKPGEKTVLRPARLTCPDKITVVGSLVRPDGSVAVRAAVVARAVEQLRELTTLPLPMGESETVTDESGRFSLALDPAKYQFDFIPSDGLPRTSRVVIVRADIPDDAGGRHNTIDLKEFALWNSRQVTGTVTLPATASAVGLPAINATVRYFRVTTVEGRPASLLLGEAVTDDRGNYSVTLPAR